MCIGIYISRRGLIGFGFLTRCLQIWDNHYRTLALLFECKKKSYGNKKSETKEDLIHV